MMTVWWVILKNDNSMVRYNKNDDILMSYTKEWWQYGELY